MIPILVALMDCEVSPFPRTLYPEDSGLSIFFTQSGIEKWFRNILNSNAFNISGLKFPDIKTTLNLGFTKMDMMLTDIIVSEFSVEETGVMMKNDNVLPIVLSGAKFVLRFNWKIQQQSYPYTPDSGTGQVIVSDTDFQAHCTIGCDFKVCPNHLVVDILHMELQIGIFKVVLEGGSSWLYQSMLDLIMGVLQLELEKLISGFLSSTVVKLLNELLNKYVSYEPYRKFERLTKDERFVSQWVIRDGYMFALLSGYVYHVNDYSDEFVTRDKLGRVTYNRFNVESEITVSEACFNNLYYIMHKYEDAYSCPGQFQVTAAPVIEFYSAAALLTLRLLVNDSVVDVQLKGEPKYAKVQAEKNNTVYYFQFEKYGIRSEDLALDLDSFEQVVVDNINFAMKTYYYLQMNSYIYDTDRFQYSLDPLGKVLRVFQPYE
ncbi:Conserved_hypothetical protein [Hexamita inflata]|uniref:Uncharacterized protein n=1 Tax=Hexamita inflata TaxID=28002 RepID=A0AA86NPA0_9EUKA|nr:Conserved hypothetical protein [Hexamita inflata]